MKKFTFTLLVCLFLGTFVSFADNSPYVTRVLKFVQAPGQFINQSYPTYTSGDTEAATLTNVATAHVGKTGGLITLGAYGGYEIVGFDHPIVNAHTYDFNALGNAFSGFAEPGIVMVSQDTNGNGLPDDAWYELAGSEYKKDTTVHNYQITYYRPQYDIKIRNGETPNAAYINSPATYRTTTSNTNIADVPWKDNLGRSGYVLRNGSHKQQSYYPLWIEADSVVFSGSLLSNKTNNAFSYGYVDNLANSTTVAINNGFKIDWAVDKYGNPANLTQIDFVKVYSALNKDGGMFGEISTEFESIQDLHPSASAAADTNTRINLSAVALDGDGKSTITLDESATSFDVNSLFRFSHAAIAAYSSWDGFICSNKQANLSAPSNLYNTDGSVNTTAVASWEYDGANQYATVAGGGVKGSGTPYLVGYWNAYGSDNGCNLTFADGNAHSVQGTFVNNIATTYLSMKYGDSFAKKFGGPTGTDKDYLKLIAIGKNGDTETGRDTICLANFSSQYACDDYMVKDWTWMDLTSLGKVTKVQFVMATSDNGTYGANTPLYFALDGLTVSTEATTGIETQNSSSISVYPNPATDYVIVSGAEGARIELYALSGVKLKSVLSNAAQINVLISDLPVGTYVMKVVNSQSVRTLKVIKK